ncbi:MAG: dTDP-4-dehydrorhamnose 3,5-epimerase [Verrucomicrobiota bacterium]
MKFTETPLKDAWVIDLETRGDDRGYFARAFCQKEFDAHGIESKVVQSNVSYSKHAGTLRGMHFQKDPAQETKLVRCVRGSLYDVIVDLREDSPTYLKHFGVELTAANKRMLFVPRGFGHGFMTLEDDTEALYMVSEFYSPEFESGVRHDDPALGISWPLEVTVISDKDANWPLLDLR